MSTRDENLTPDVRSRQRPLREKYRESPQAAWVTDRASIQSNNLHNPLRGNVSAGSVSKTNIAFSVHRSIGGSQEAPVPGDLLCAALASCQESSLRMVANVYGIVITALSVDVKAHVDVRGTLGMSSLVPVGFQLIEVEANLDVAPGTSAEKVRHLLRAAERACVVLQTLRGGVDVRLDINISGSEVAS